MKEYLFKLVFNNIVIFRLICRYSRIFNLYEKNKCISFSNRNELLEYKDIDYIEKIIYEGDEMLKKNDLPLMSRLKEITFTSQILSLIQGLTIPDGVEIINYSIHNLYYNKVETTPLSTLPSSVTTVTGVVFKKFNTIPMNIKSLSIIDSKCPNISGVNRSSYFEYSIPKFFCIPVNKSLTFLEFPCDWNNEGIPFRIGDIPNGITSLSIIGYIQPLEKGILPNSIMSLSIGTIHNDYLPSLSNLSSLCLYLNSEVEISPRINLNQCNSIKKLMIHFTAFPSGRILPFSLPQCVTDLKLENIDFTIKNNVIPNSVKILELYQDNSSLNCGLLSSFSLPNNIQQLIFSKYSSFNQTIVTLPSSLTSLQLNDEYSIDNLIQIIPILPTSLTTITLSTEMEETLLNDSIIKFPSHINNIIFK